MVYQPAHTQHLQVIMIQYTEFLKSVFSAAFFDFIPFACITNHNYEFFHSLLGSTLLPIGISALLWLVIIINPRHQRRNALNIFFLLTYLVYPSVSTKVLNVWTCERYSVAGDPTDTAEGNFERYLLVDFSTNCNSFKYLVMQLYGGLMILVYPVGIPAFYTVLLYRSRNELYPGLEKHGVRSMFTPSHTSWTAPEQHELSPEHMLFFLVSSYKPRAFWFELVECFRRIALSR